MISLPKNREVLKKVLADLHNIDNNRVFFIEWLKSESGRLEELNRTEREDIQLRWRQGAIQTLSTLISELGQAKETYNRIGAT